MPNETSEILVRNLKELFKDTNLTEDNALKEFAEANTQKSLANIFPDYRPYTPWPNGYEVIDQDGYVAMIYKSINRKDTDIYHYLIAPTDGVVTFADGDSMEFAYRSVDGEIYRLTMLLGEKTHGASIEMLVSTGDVVTAGVNIAKIKVPKATNDYRIHVLLSLHDGNGEKLYVPDYMEVQQRELTAEEIITMHNYIMNEGAGQGEEGQAALASVILNRIKDPTLNHYPNAIDIISTIEETMKPPGGKDGSWLEKDLRTKLWGEERYALKSYGGEDVITRQILLAIAKATRGYDPTKDGVPKGATAYANKEEEKDKYTNKKHTAEISSLVYYAEQEGDMSRFVGGSASEYKEMYDDEEWQKEFVLYLCMTIKNSYYFENSEALEYLLNWARMEEEEEQRKETE